MIDIFTIVWGEMIESYLGITLPGLLQSGNIPATKKLIYDYTFYTDDSTKEAIMRGARFHELENLVHINWESLKKGIPHVNSNVKYQWKLSAQRQHYAFNMTPDTALGNWSLFNIASLADGTRNPVQYVFPRIPEDAYHKLIKIFEERKEISNRELVTFVAKNADISKKQVANNKWIASHNGPNACILPDKWINETFASNNTPNHGIHHCLIYLIAQKGYPYYVIPHSDTYFQVERGVHIIRKYPHQGSTWLPDLWPISRAFWMKYKVTWRGV